MAHLIRPRLVRASSAAILRAQVWMWLNFYRRYGPVSFVLSLLLTAVWYGGFSGLALAASALLSQPAILEAALRYLGPAFLLVFAYWQGMPLLMASVGGILDCKKLVIYPVSEAQLFRVELLLRTLFFAEMPIFMLGVGVGLARNDALPATAALAPLLFTLFNLGLGAGLRDLLARVLARPGWREAAILGLVLLTAVPMLLTTSSIPLAIRDGLRQLPLGWLPWTAAADAALGRGGARPWLALTGWTGAAWWFSRRQFRRALTMDGPSPARTAPPAGSRQFLERALDYVWRWPSRIFPDPLGVLIEKEIRFLSRVSRFRIVFFMGFSFGLLIWLPLVGGWGGQTNPWLAGNFLSVVAAYALLLLGEVCFYNSFGFDRSAAQLYFLAPLRPVTVLAAKNIAAVFYVALEVALVTVGCWLFRLPVTVARLAEAVAVSAVMTLFLLGIGNLGSTRSPRSQNPVDGWRRTSGSKMALLALACYPLLSLPIALAYLARWALRQEWAFYAVTGVALLVATIFYRVSLDSAVESLDRDREKFVKLLGQTDAPVV